MFLYTGEAHGKLVEADCLEPGVLANEAGPVILLARGATGDEEVSTAGSNLAAVLLAHGLPHLSHLGAPSHFLIAKC